MNYAETKIMTPENVQISVDNVALEIVNEYNYLSHIISFGKKTEQKKSADGSSSHG